MKSLYSQNERPEETQERATRANATWLFSGFSWESTADDVPRDLVRQLLADCGHQNDVDKTPEAALSAAAKKGYRRGRAKKGESRYITQAFVSPNNDTPMSIQVGRFVGQDESGDTFECLARCRIGHRTDPTTGLDKPFIMARPPEGQTDYSDSGAEARAREIAQIANHDLEYITNSDLSRLLSKVLKVNGSIQALGRGNNYYLRPRIVEALFDLFETLSSRKWIRFETHSILQGEYFAPQDASKVADAVVVKFESELTELEKKLEKAAEKVASSDRGQDGFLRKSIGQCELISTELCLLSDVLTEKYNNHVNRIEAAQVKLKKGFSTILNGGWDSDDEPPATDRSPESDPVSSTPVSITVTTATEVPTEDPFDSVNF